MLMVDNPLPNPTIRELAASGLGWEDLAAILRARGDSFSPSWLRDYVIERRWK